MGRFIEGLFPHVHGITRVLVIVAFVVAVHLIVLGVRHVARKVASSRIRPSLSKTKTLAGLAMSILVFALYFVAGAFILDEFNVSLKAYLASASIIGLAVGFGTQGLVQDVITGLTVIFSDLFDLGDMVEISGQTGIVESIGMRFTVLTNSMGGRVYIPNRTLANVITYPRGYVRCLADITLPGPEHRAQAEETARRIATSTFEQFPGILRTPPEIGRVQITSSGRTFMRVKFRIWPGRGAPIETNFRQEVIQALRAIDSSFADWMVAVNYEVEQTTHQLGER